MKSDFCVAVHALVYLNHKKHILSSEQLAENICTNPARVRKIMAVLKKHNMVETKEGIDGGYQIIQDAETITLDKIAEILQVEFVATTWRSGDPDMECLVASGMADIMSGIFGELNELCRKYLTTISVAAIDKKIFGEKEANRMQRNA